MVAEPHPTRMRCSSAPFTIGGLDRPARSSVRAAVDLQRSTACLLPSFSMSSQVTRPSLLGAAGEVMHAPDRQKLRAVLDRGHMSDRFAVMQRTVDCSATEKPVGVDLDLETAVAEDAFGHHRDHVHARVLRGHDERRWLVVGIGGAAVDRRHEHRRVADDGPVPARALHRHRLRALAAHQQQRLGAGEHAADVAPAVAGRPGARR